MRNRAHWTNALTITTCMMSLFLWIGKLSPRSWGRLPVCQRRMQFMCVGLLLSLTERFVYGSDAFFLFLFFFFFRLRHLLHPLYTCQQISVRGASVIDYTQPCRFFCFASVWNVLSILHLYLHPRCSSYFYFQNLWFFGRKWILSMDRSYSVHTTKAICYLV